MQTARDIAAVTGAFGYSGQYIATRLLERGLAVRNLTNSPRRSSPLQGRVAIYPLAFDNDARLTESLRGVRVLYNTYWVRFNRAGFRHAVAVTNTQRLFAAAQRANVQRVVHVSITNADEHSPLEYFSGKGLLERDLAASGMSHAILRPTVLFGVEDILINNIAWVLRRFPVFGLFGDGSYRLQPIHVDDLAALAVRAGEDTADGITDAIGPEIFTFRELVACIAGAIGVRRPIIALPPALGYAVGWIIGRIVGDVIVTREEIEGLMAGLLWSTAPPTGATVFSEWALAHAARLGKQYASELARRQDRKTAYATP
jgi:NADH dehydrogenase